MTKFSSFRLWRSLTRIFSDARTLYLWVVMVLLVPNIVLDITEPYSFPALAANILFPAGLYGLILTFRRQIGGAVFICLPFMILAGFQLVLSYLYGESIIAVDMFLNVVTTNVDEVNELLGNIIYAIAAVVILYLPPLAWAATAIFRKWKLPENFTKQCRKWSWISMASGLALSLAVPALHMGASMRHSLFPVNVICNLVEAVNRTNRINNYAHTSAHFRYGASSTRPASDREVYVMVIGETSRAINWQLAGYGRPTNPRLSHVKNLVFFPKAISESNTTHKSVPMLMSAVSSENFDSLYSYKSIITAMKEAGFHTYFFSNQAPNRSFTQFFGEEADDVRYTDLSSKPHPYDHELAAWLSEAVEDTVFPKKFFVLHTYGTHFLYRDRYPADFSYFQPDNALDANRANRASLINGYDNSIRYTDYVLADIIDTLNGLQCRAGMIYSADHGEDIFDDERNRFLHASPNPTYYQVHVASLAWLNDSLSSDMPQALPALRKNATMAVSPQKSLFHTMLEMSGVTTPVFALRRSLVNPAFKSPDQLLYITDVNQCVPLVKAGMKETDITKINNLINGEHAPRETFCTTPPLNN